MVLCIEKSVKITRNQIVFPWKKNRSTKSNNSTTLVAIEMNKSENKVHVIIKNGENWVQSMLTVEVWRIHWKTYGSNSKKVAMREWDSCDFFFAVSLYNLNWYYWKICNHSDPMAKFNEHFNIDNPNKTNIRIYFVVVDCNRLICGCRKLAKYSISSVICK